MRYDGIELTTVGQIVDYGMALPTKAETQRLMRHYRSITPYADSNIAYYSGYYTAEEGSRVRDKFGVRN